MRTFAAGVTFIFHYSFFIVHYSFLLFGSVFVLSVNCVPNETCIYLLFYSQKRVKLKLVFLPIYSIIL